MNKISSYGKVYNLGHKALEHILSGAVTIEEKVDGSQFSFARAGDTLLCRSNGQQLNVNAPEKMFELAVMSCKERFDLLHDGWIYRGEFLSKPKHNTLCYGRVPNGNIVIFDIDKGEQDYLNYKDKIEEAKRIGLECVPFIHEGILSDISHFKDLLEQDSFLGNAQIEGVVVKNYSQFGLDGKALKGKFVSEKFKEVHNKDWKERHPGGTDIKDQISEELRTEARWEKAVQHLREAGTLTDSPKDIGPLMKEICQDSLTECEEHVKLRLFKWAWQDISRKLTRGFPQWYKERLLERQFDNERESA